MNSKKNLINQIENKMKIDKKEENDKQVKLLGCDQSKRDSKGGSVNAIVNTVNLWQAIRLGNLSAVKYHFRSNPIDLLELDPNNKNYLHVAALYSNLRVVQFLVKNHLDVNSKDAEGTSPIMLAIIANQKDIVHFLIKQGANVNHQNYYKRTPLHYAIGKNRLAIVQLLMENGASIHNQDIIGKTPIEYMTYIQLEEDRNAIQNCIQEYLHIIEI